MDQLEALEDWRHTVSTTRLDKGTSSWAVTALKQLLEAAGKPVGNDTVEYDDALAAIVGDNFGGQHADELIASLRK